MASRPPGRRRSPSATPAQGPRSTATRTAGGPGVAADAGAAACCRRDQPKPTPNHPLDGDGQEFPYALRRPRRHDRRGRPNVSPTAAGLRWQTGCPNVAGRSVAGPAPRRRVRHRRPTALTCRSVAEPAAGPPPDADRPHETDRSRIDPAPHPAWSSRRRCHSPCPEFFTARQTAAPRKKAQRFEAVRHDHHTVDSPSTMAIELIDARTTQKTESTNYPIPSDDDFLTTVIGTSPSDALWPLWAADGSAGLAPVGWTEPRLFHSFVRGF